MVSGWAFGTPRSSNSIFRFSKPMLSVFGRRPTAASRYCAVNVPLCPSSCHLTSTLPSPFRPTSVSAFRCRVSSSPNTVLASSSTTGSVMPPSEPPRPKISTFTPNRESACPSSKPMTPGPKTATLSGRVSHENTSSLIIRRSPKACHCGKTIGREPVAITMRSARIWVWSSICTVCSSMNLAEPMMRFSDGHASTSSSTNPTKRSRSDLTRFITSSPFTVMVSLSR